MRNELTLVENKRQIVLTDLKPALSGNPPFQHGQLLPTWSTRFPSILALLNEIFAPGPAFRDDLEESRSNGARARFQRRRHDLDLRRLDLRKIVECLERRTMPHCSFEVRDGQLHVSSL